MLIQTEEKPETNNDAMADHVTKHTVTKIPKGRLITCGSRFLTSAEANYAVIELELLAIQWAVAKCRLYLAGADFQVITDHQPLLGVLNGRNLDAVQNTRIHRIMAKLLGYRFKVLWTPGKTQSIADALSRFPVFKPEEKPDILVCSVLVRQASTEETTSCSLDPALEKLNQYAAKDAEYQMVLNAVKTHKKLGQLPRDHPAQDYRSHWDAMSVEPGLPKLMLYHGRIMIPKDAKREILETLHMQHSGETKSLANARQLYFWYGMTNDIKKMVSGCEECLKLKPCQHMEPTIQTVATRPFESVSVDLGYLNGVHYLVLVDRYSGWPMVKPLKKLNTTAVTTILHDWFLDMGKPVNLRSDGGPQFRQEFEDWCKDQCINHELSSPYNHQSNGHAEVAVREMKNLLAKTGTYPKFRLALREWRNTPRFDGLSPAQWLTGHRQRTEAIATPKAYQRVTDEQLKTHMDRRGQVQSQTKERVDRSKRDLEQLEPGDQVWVQDPKSLKWSTKATVLSIRKNKRSYLVKSDDRVFIRNRRFLRPDPSPGPTPDGPGPKLRGPGPTSNKDSMIQGHTNDQQTCSQQQKFQTRRRVTFN